jgi:signal peptidase
VTAIGSTLEWVQFRLASLCGTRALLGTQGIAYLFFGVGGLVLLSGLFGDRGRNAERTTQREPARKNIYDGRALVLVLFALLVAVTAGTMLVASGSNETGIVSAEFESDRADVIPNGETKNHLITVGNDGILPMVVMLEPASEGVGLNDSVHYLKRGEQTNITVSYTAPPETGYYVRSFDEYRYFGILPTSIIQSLHSIHPWIALFAVTMFLVTPLGIGIRLLLGTGRIRTRTRQRNTPHKLR